MISFNSNDPVIKLDSLYEEFSMQSNTTPGIVPFYLE
jgi:hypothetical protein